MGYQRLSEIGRCRLARRQAAAWCHLAGAAARTWLWGPSDQAQDRQRAIAQGVARGVGEADKRDLSIQRPCGRRSMGSPGGRACPLCGARSTGGRSPSQTRELERRFLPLARAAGLPPPRTGQHVNGFKVDSHWPDLGLVVETDGLRYHRTPAQQVRDHQRDQAHPRQASPRCALPTRRSPSSPCTSRQRCAGSRDASVATLPEARQLRP